MWSQTYTQQHLKQIDNALYSMMRARSVQEVVNIFIPDDPPRDRFEYMQAGKVFLMRISMSQPNAWDRDAPSDQAYRIAPTSSYPPLTLIGHWARVAVLSIALKEYENGLGYVLGMQETACQFGDDNILLSAARMGFGIASLVIPIKAEAEALYRVASMCEIAVLGKKGRCSQIHGEGALTLCRLFYSILQDFAKMHDPKVRRPGITFLYSKLVSEAEDIDKATGKKFRMKNWVEDTVKQLGYRT